MRAGFTTTSSRPYTRGGEGGGGGRHGGTFPLPGPLCFQKEIGYILRTLTMKVCARQIELTWSKLHDSNILHRSPLTHADKNTKKMRGGGGLRPLPPQDGHRPAFCAQKFKVWYMGLDGTKSFILGDRSICIKWMNLINYGLTRVSISLFLLLFAIRFPSILSGFSHIFCPTLITKPCFK